MTVPIKHEGGAAPGNQKGVALKDPEIRQLAYKSYCDHLARGKVKKSWTFEKHGLQCTYKTMESYLSDEEEFPPIHKELAEAKGYALWEEIVEQAASDKNTKANTACLQMIMRNKFGWDKKEDAQVTQPTACNIIDYSNSDTTPQLPA